MPELRGWARGTVGAAAALAAIAGVALASRMPVGDDAKHAELRLALRAPDARLEICRDRSAEELERLLAHFRVARVCDEIPVDYRLTVEIDGTGRLDRVLRHRGARRTRPLAVDEALEVAPGPRRVAIRFAPIPPAALADERLRPARGGDEDDVSESADEETEENTTGEPDDRDERYERIGSTLAAAFAALGAPELATVIEFRAGRAELVVLGEDGRLVRRQAP